MSRPLKFGIFFGAVVLLFAGCYALLVTAVAPRVLRDRLTSAVKGACESCELEIGAVALEFFNPFDISMRDLRLKAGTEGGSEAKIRIGSLRVQGSFDDSTRENIVIETITVDEPDITFIDGDAVSKKSPSSEESRFTFVVKKTEINGGSFTYTRNTKGTSATLHLSRVNGALGAVGTEPSLREKMTEARLHARLEKSGEVEIDVAALLRPGPDHVDVTVHIRDQNLNDVTPFFNPNAGVELNGQMVKARGRVQVRDQDLHADTWIVYHGLELKLNPMYDRSEAEAFFMNLGTDLVMKEEDLGLPKDLQTKGIHARREPGERIVGFILRGLKEAAIKVAQTAAPQNRAKPKERALDPTRIRPGEKPK